ncbi:MAG: response regulator [Rubrimonas sp.]|uniref:response regulator n=1 Tax=Rubrimonas sp. TaxID=2036015 RepID=UPI002FDDE72F
MSGRTILTVDDSRTMRNMLRMTLEDEGYRVLEAADGLLGLDVLKGEIPDVIVTDINMPNMDGFGFIEAVRAEARYDGVPILVLTTESDRSLKDRARNSGATGWITKPFEQNRLIDVVRRVMA